MIKLSVVIITKNAARILKRCMDSVAFADEIIVIDSNSIDETKTIAEAQGAHFLVHSFIDFADQRNQAIRLAKGDWLLYIDADEVVTDALRDEIKQTIVQYAVSFAAYKIKRKNYYYGSHQWPYIEHIERLFRKDLFIKWQGEVHESPIVKGTVGELNNYIEHYTHTDLSAMIVKTNEWSAIEAKLLYQSGHPIMVGWRFIRIMCTKFCDSYIRQGGWRVGVVGLIESIYQAFSYFIVYVKLWEKQLSDKT